MVGLAGSVTTVAALALGLPAYDADRIHHSVIRAEDVHGIAQSLLAQTRAERAQLSVMHPGRVDVIGAGALVTGDVKIPPGSLVLGSPAKVIEYFGPPGQEPAELLERSASNADTSG